MTALTDARRFFRSPRPALTLMAAALILPWWFPPQTLLSSFFWVAPVLALWLTLRTEPLVGPAPAWSLPFALVVAAPLISSMFSAEPAASLPFAHRSLIGPMLFWLAWVLVPGPKPWRYFSRVLIGAGALLALVALYQHFIGLAGLAASWASAAPAAGVDPGVVERALTRRAFAGLASPNLLAGVLAMLIPPAIGSFLAARTRLGRGWGAVTLGCLITGLFVTGSLAGWLAAAIGTSFFFWARPARDQAAKRNWIWTSLAVMLMGFFAIWWTRGAPSAGQAITGRADAWWQTWKIFLEYPWLGTGPGMLADILGGRTLPSAFPARYAHSVLFQTLAEVGLLGAAAWAWFLVSVLRTRRPPGTPRPSVVLDPAGAGLAGALIAGACHALVDVDLSFDSNAYLFWALAGVACQWFGTPDPGTPPVQHQRAWPSWRAIGVSILVAILMVSVWGAGRSQASAVSIYLLVMLGFSAMIMDPQPGNGRFHGRSDRFAVYGVGAFLGWGVFSAVWSGHPSAAVPGLSLGVSGLILFWAAHRYGGARALSIAGCAAGAGLTLVLLARDLGALTFPEWAAWPNPNLLAAFLSMSLILILVRLFFHPAAGLRRTVLWTAAAALFWALLRTGSVSGLVNFLAGYGILHWQIQRTGRIEAGQNSRVVFVLLAAGLTGWAALGGPGVRKLADYGAQAYERVHLLQAAVRLGAERPWSGSGPGTFGETFAGQAFSNIRGLTRFGKEADFAHNEVLQIFAVLGVPGVLLLLWVAVLTIRRIGVRLRRAPPGDAGDSGLWPAGAAVLAGAAAQGMLDFNWHVPALFLWYMAWLGIALGPTPSGAPAVPDQPARFMPWTGPRPLIIGVLAAWGALGLIRPVLSTFLEQRGQTLAAWESPAAERAYANALALFPWSDRVYAGLEQFAFNEYTRTRRAEWLQRAQWAGSRVLELNQLDAQGFRRWGGLNLAAFLTLEENARWPYWAEALLAYQQALVRAPSDAFLYFELGNVRRSAEYMLMAAQAYRRAVELEPFFAAAWNNLGAVLMLRGEVSGAAECFRQALAAPAGSAGISPYERHVLGSEAERVVAENNLRWLTEARAALGRRGMGVHDPGQAPN